MLLSSTIIDGEKKDLEDKISYLEAKKGVDDKKAKELKAQVEELEAQNNSLETWLKEENERQVDITPLREHAFQMRRETYQV